MDQVVLTTDQVYNMYVPSITSINKDLGNTYFKLGTNSTEEKETNMCFETNNTPDASLKYLRNRLSDLNWKFNHDIREKYSDLEPKSSKEAAKWLKDRNYHFVDVEPGDFDEDSDDFTYNYHSPFRWGKEPVDYKARDKAFDDLEKARQTASDIINVVTDESKRLQALKDFESYTIH